MITLGPHTLSNKVFLAPMAGVTDLPFRKICRSLGVGMVVGEMCSSLPSLRDTRKSRLRGVHLDEPAPRSVQIVGWDPQAMAEAARYNVDQGASIIDINMGCPAKKVCNRLAGSALLGDESQVTRILDAVVDSVSVPVTLKIRTGIDPDNRNGVAIAKIAEKCGVSLLAVHGRTRTDRFVGQVEYETIRRIKSAVSIPVIANGDIVSLSRAREVLAYTGADGVMIGRAANGSPWLPGLIAKGLDSGKTEIEPDIACQGRIAVEHVRALHDFYGETQGVRIARKHIKWYTEKFADSKRWRQSLNAVENVREQLLRLQEFYEIQCERNESAQRVAA